MHRYLLISDIFVIFKIMFCWKSVCKVTQGILSLANGNVEDQQRSLSAQHILAQHLIMCQFCIRHCTSHRGKSFHNPWSSPKKNPLSSLIHGSPSGLVQMLPSPHTSSLILHAAFFSSRNLILVVRTNFHVHWLYWCAFTASRLPHHLIRRDAPLGSQYNQPWV